jgi:hypothetical protein
VTDLEDLRLLLTGFRVSAALSVAAELGLSDELAAGPRDVGDLAAAVGADEDSLLRLLRALVTVGAYAEGPDRVFTSTPLGDGLRSDVPGTLRPLARMFQDGALWAAWGHLGHSVRTGENAFEALHGVDVWAHRRAHPERNEVFNQAMAAQSAAAAAAVVAAYDFSGAASVVDVGGGQGALLEAVLAANPALVGTVFDQAHALPAAAPTTASPSVARRWRTRAGSFFEEVPAADAYLLKLVLHDWPDDECVQILRTCRRSLIAGGSVLVVETVLDRPGQEQFAAFSDLNMLVLPGGRERTERQYTALLDAAGLRLAAVHHTTGRLSVLEARAAQPA